MRIACAVASAEENARACAEPAPRWRRQPLLATCVMVAGLSAAAMLTGVFSTEWIDHLERRNPGELLLITASVFGPILAVLLTPRKPDWPSTGS